MGRVILRRETAYPELLCNNQVLAIVLKHSRFLGLRSQEMNRNTGNGQNKKYVFRDGDGTRSVFIMKSSFEHTNGARGERIGARGAANKQRER